MEEVPFQIFVDKFKDNLNHRSLPDCFQDICSGWTQETLRQNILQMSKKGVAPIKLWFDSPQEMMVMTNKAQTIETLFKYLDYKGLGRIDSMELLTVIALASDGKIEILLGNIMNMFGFSSSTSFSKDECYFFLDCMFRGIMKLVTPIGEKKPIFAGKRIAHRDLEDLALEIFPMKKYEVERDRFIQLI